MSDQFGDRLSRTPHVQNQGFVVLEAEARKHVSGYPLSADNSKEGRVAHCSRLLNAIRARGVSSDDSYKMVECSRVRRSKARSEPSAPTETKMSEEFGSQDLCPHQLINAE